jgi:hypothetical protein
VGFLDPVTTGSGFDLLHFTIRREGVIIEDQTFATAALATAYFNDHVISLGSKSSGVTGDLDLIFTMDVTNDALGDGFRTNLVLANVPEPSAAVLVLGGVALLVGRQRRNRR